MGKFQFDHSFDHPGAGGKPVPIPMLAEDIAALKAAAHAEGYAEARASLLKDLETRRQAVLENVAAAIARLPQILIDEERQRNLEAAQMTIAIAKKFLPEAISKTAGGVLDDMVRAALAEGRDEPRFVIRVAGSELEHLQENLNKLAGDAGFVGQVVLLSDPARASADCRIEWAEGGLERSATSLWQSIERVVADYCGAVMGTDVSKTTEGDKT